MTRLLILLLCSACSVMGSTPSYWFSGWQTKPDAQQAQAYFLGAGSGITFTYTNNLVWINSLGGGGGGTTNNYYYTNTFTTNYFFTNTFTTNYYATNYVTTNQYYTNFLGQTNIYATNLIGLLSTNGIAFYTNSAGALVISNSAGSGGSQTPWLQTEDAAGYDLLNVHTLRPYSINQATNSRFQFDSAGQMFLAFSTSGGGTVRAENNHGFPEINFGLDSTVKWQYKSAVTDPPNGSSQIHFYGGSGATIDLNSGFVGIDSGNFTLESGTVGHGNGSGFSNVLSSATLVGMATGVATLAGASVTVSTPSVHTTSKIVLTYVSTDGVYAIVSVGTIVDGSSFVINSSNPADTHQVNWALFAP